MNLNHSTLQFIYGSVFDYKLLNEFILKTFIRRYEHFKSELFVGKQLQLIPAAKKIKRRMS